MTYMPPQVKIIQGTPSEVESLINALIERDMVMSRDGLSVWRIMNMTSQYDRVTVLMQRMAGVE